MSIVLDTPTFDLLNSPFREFDNQFPENLFVTYHKTTDRHGCFCVGNDHGLAVFSTADNASNFMAFLDLDRLEVQEISFDEALDLAKTKPHPVTCIHLLDEMSNPKTIYVK